jgi:fumarylacetoacetate (FAA) hydrolase family protein
MWEDVEELLPVDGLSGIFVGRIWSPEGEGGPLPVRVRDDGVYDLSHLAPTLAEILNLPDVASIIRASDGRQVGETQSALANSAYDRRNPELPYFLAPSDLQATKAAGVTFVKSMLERVIEEQARGDLKLAEEIRLNIADQIGGSLRDIDPGSEAAERVKKVLLEQGLWSQYLEVGIGPDAEIFTKCQPLASVGIGAQIGIHPKSIWNNPEPEAVLSINSRGQIIGATLGNDVNLRDFEGRSALLLGKAKDNRASSALGPFIRLFDDSFDIDDVRQMQIVLRVVGEDGFVMEGSSSLSEISRDLQALAEATVNENNQFPDGVMLYTGTMFAPTEDRDAAGQGFTHHVGDVVSISNNKLGKLVNRVEHSDQIAPWSFGISHLMQNLAKRGML